MMVAGACAVTLVGGLFALRLRRHLQWITAFTSGVLVAVALLDLLPEAFALSPAPAIGHLLTLTGFAFLALYLLDLLVPEHHAEGHEHHHHAPAEPRAMGIIGASLLCVHSGVDGMMMVAAERAGGGLALLAIAIIFHRFADGVSTVSMMLRNGQGQARTRIFVVVVALCPLLGLLSAWVRPFADGELGPALAIFAGLFLYAGGSHLSIREHGHEQRLTPLITALGFVLVWVFR
jgi:ZIP family zinc transporter